MIFKQNYNIQIRDTERSTEATNKALLGLMEDIGGLHSNQVGFGIYDIEKTHLTWVLLEWKLKVISRPKYGDEVTIKTWSRLIEKYYAYRDFEVYDKDGNQLAIATSKWILINTEKGAVTKVEDYVAEPYQSEPARSVFCEEKLDKLKESDEYSSILEYKIARRDIDMYNHVHNLYYLDLAYEILPEDIYNAEELKNVRITYKREIKLGDEIKCMYKEKGDKHQVVIKSKDEKTMHAILEIW